MKKIIVLLLGFVPLISFGQYREFSYNFPADSISKIIVKGGLKRFSEDSVLLIFSRERSEKSKMVSIQDAHERVRKILSRGNPEFGGSSNGGRSFSLIIFDKLDGIEVLGTVSFRVSFETDKINEIVIYK